MDNKTAEFEDYPLGNSTDEVNAAAEKFKGAGFTIEGGG